MFKHILVPLDGSVFAEAAVEHAVALCKKFGSRLSVMRVATSPQLYMSEFVLGLPDAAELYVNLRQQALLDAESYVAVLQSRLAASAVTAETLVEESTQVADAIVHAAAQIKADLIVMTTHGRSGFQRWMLGSVAESVVRQALMPVLLVRSQPAAVPNGQMAAKEMLHV